MTTTTSTPNDGKEVNQSLMFMKVPSCKGCANLKSLQRPFDPKRPMHLNGPCSVCAGASKFKPLGFKAHGGKKKTVIEAVTPSKKKK